ncbi:transposase domain-containing protein [Azorhizophilus paspali]|uniref:Transposase domain-containing protein n=1 Tax=Azorhizophilus paspali TaxID=69963 RepID=A0ABV6SPA0_AZOPA
MTGTVSLRRHRRLPAEHIIWLVVGMALFKSKPIQLVVQQPGLSKGNGLTPALSATLQIRQRLNETPTATLFKQLARAWLAMEPPASARFRRLRIFAADTAAWSMPDTAKNREAFSGGRNQ